MCALKRSSTRDELCVLSREVALEMSCVCTRDELSREVALEMSCVCSQEK